MWLKQSQLNNLAAQLTQLKHEAGLHPLRQQVLRQQLLARLGAAGRQNGVPDRYLWQSRAFRLVPAAVSLMLVLLLTGGTVLAAQGSLPGDTLYPVKRLTETVELKLATSEQSKVELQAKHAGERLNELHKLDVKVEAVQGQAQAQAQVQSQPAPAPQLQPEVARQRDEAEVDTHDQLETALNALHNAQAKLEVKGDTRSAAKLNEVFQNLRRRATPTFRAR